MTTFKTYQSLIQDAKARIKTNPTDTEYVNTQLIKILEWQTEMMKLQSDPNFKLSDKVYTFKNKSEFKELINNEKKIASKLYKTTGMESYNKYELYCYNVWQHYSEATDEEIQDIRIDNLREFIVSSYAKWSARFNRNCDIMSGKHGWIQSEEGRFGKEYLYWNNEIKDIFNHGCTSLQEK